jgi:hypothetical protein
VQSDVEPELQFRRTRPVARSPEPGADQHKEGIEEPS